MKLKIFSIATRFIKSIFLLVFLAFLLGATFQSARAGEFVIKDQASCESFGGTWLAPDFCSVLNFSLASGDTLTVMGNVTLHLPVGGNNNGTVNNYGVIFIEGTIPFMNFGTINNYGTIHIFLFLDNQGIIRNICQGAIWGPVSNAVIQMPYCRYLPMIAK